MLKITNPPHKQSNKWITFTFHGPSVHKVTNLFRKTGLKIAFRPTNTIFKQLTQKQKKKITPAGYISLSVIRVTKPMWDNPGEQYP